MIIFDRDKILDNNKGSFFERLFNTTSKEYKEFVKNFKKFTDPKHPDISVKNKLIASANAYLRHKGVNEAYDVFNLDEGTGKERAPGSAGPVAAGSRSAAAVLPRAVRRRICTVPSSA